VRILAACTTICLLASWHIAQAQTNPAQVPTKGPQDKSISGVFTPDRVKSDIEAAAKKAQTSGAAPSTRGRFYYFAWSSMTCRVRSARQAHGVSNRGLDAEA
jgi:hypothetical protein